MSDVLNQDGPHLGGLAALFFLPVAALPQLPDVAADGVSLLGNLVLRPGASWAQLRGSIYTAALDVAASTTAQGAGYDHDLGGFIAGDRPDVAAQFQKMQGRRFVLLYRDFEGAVRLVGDPRGGLEFTHKLVTGAKPGEKKGYAWGFKGRTGSPALFYAGQLPPELDVLTPPTASSGGSVELRTAGGQLLAVVPAGKKIYLKSGFKLTFTIV